MLSGVRRATSPSRCRARSGRRRSCHHPRCHRAAAGRCHRRTGAATRRPGCRRSRRAAPRVPISFIASSPSSPAWKMRSSASSAAAGRLEPHRRVVGPVRQARLPQRIVVHQRCLRVIAEQVDHGRGASARAPPRGRDRRAPRHTSRSPDGASRRGSAWSRMATLLIGTDLTGEPRRRLVTRRATAYGSSACWSTCSRCSTDRRWRSRAWRRPTASTSRPPSCRRSRCCS